MNEFTSRGPVIAESQVSDVERRIAVQLPLEYRQFLISQNGGRPARPCFLDTGVKLFYSIDVPEAWRDLEDKFSLFSRDETFPKGVIPIATDYFGNQVVLSIDGTDSGSIEFWEHDIEDAPLVIVAPSFNSFVESLRDSDHS